MKVININLKKYDEYFRCLHFQKFKKVVAAMKNISNVFDKPIQKDSVNCGMFICIADEILSSCLTIDEMKVFD